MDDIQPLLIVGATSFLLMGGCGFVVMRLWRVQAKAGRKNHAPPAPSLRSMLFPDLFPVEEPEPAQARVLCVDQSTERLNAVKTLLEDEGCQVWTAKGLADGFALLHAFEFEVLVIESEWIDRDHLDRIQTIQPGLCILSPSGEPLTRVDARISEGELSLVEPESRSRRARLIAVLQKNGAGKQPSHSVEEQLFA